MDAYRLESAPEAAELDIDSMLARGALIVEWAERIASILPDDDYGSASIIEPKNKGR